MPNLTLLAKDGRINTMDRNKYHPHGSVQFITTSLEQGIMLLANGLMKSVMVSCFARAQALYPVKVNHFIVMGTHLHLMITVHNPDDVPAFMGYVKSMSAAMINIILGRRKRTVWCEDYHSAEVLKLRSAVRIIGYMYGNPGKDGLVEKIEEYPGLSSWDVYKKGGEGTIKGKLIRKSMVRRLSADEHNVKGYEEEALRIKSGARHDVEFMIDPDGWMASFNIEGQEERARVNQLIEERTRYKEGIARRQRERDGRKVLGREALVREVMNTEYLPNRKVGRAPVCYSTSRAECKQYVAKLRALRKSGREVLMRWRMGEVWVKYPPGLHPPSMPKLANVVV